MALSTSLVNRILLAFTSKDLGNEAVNAINKGAALADQTGWCAARLIVATNVSQTVDFGALKIGDKVLHVPSAAGNADFRTCAVAGDLGAAAVVGDLYVVMRAYAVPAASTQGF